jgi:hypothetical protein
MIAEETIVDARLDAAAKVFFERKHNKARPKGQFDSKGRWYPDKEEWCECCNGKGVQPNVDHRFKLLAHCCTAKHVANLFGVDREAIIKLARCSESVFRWGYIKANPVVCKRCIFHNLSRDLTTREGNEKWVESLHNKGYDKWFERFCKENIWAMPCGYATDSHKPDRMKKYEIRLKNGLKWWAAHYVYHWLKNPPDNCPFLVEHTVSAGNDCHE